MKKIVLVVALGLPLVASASDELKLTCTATHHSIDSAGNDEASMIGKGVKVTDIGTSFTVTIGKEKIYSPSLVLIDKNGEKALVGKKGDTYYTKIDGNYVIQNKGKGYVISDCK